MLTLKEKKLVKQYARSLMESPANQAKEDIILNAIRKSGLASTDNKVSQGKMPGLYSCELKGNSIIDVDRLINLQKNSFSKVSIRSGNDTLKAYFRFNN